MKKFIIIVFIILIAGGIGAFFIFKKLTPLAPFEPKPPFQEQVGRCGDNICDAFEKANPNLCPKDCLLPVQSSLPQKTTSSERPPVTAKPEYQVSNDSPFGIHDPGLLTAENDIAGIGAKWTRYAGRDGLVWDIIESDKGQFDWEYNDKLYLETFKKGIEIFVSITPANKFYQSTDKSPENVPRDMEAFKKFLKTAVERYDGDGIGDAPGSPIISFWQIGNELDLSFNNKSSPSEQAGFLKESYKTIKSANPAAKVAISGAAGPEGFDGARRFYLPLLEELSKIKDGQSDRYFDIFDFHWYPFNDQYDYLTEFYPGARKIYFKDYIRNVRQSLTKYGYGNTPIFITETAQYSGTPGASKNINPQTALSQFKYRSEKEQAVFLIKQYVYSLANGVKKVLWATLTEWHNFGGETGSVWDNVGLINNPQNDNESHKKLGYYTYKKMAEVLEGSDWDNIETIQEKDGVYVYKFVKNGQPIWVAWNDNTGEKQVTISGVSSSSVKITEAVPNYDSGKEVKDYAAAFKTETKQIINNKLTFTLGETPVFAEGN